MPSIHHDGAGDHRKVLVVLVVVVFVTRLAALAVSTCILFCGPRRCIIRVVASTVLSAGASFPVAVAPPAAAAALDECANPALLPRWHWTGRTQSNGSIPIRSICVANSD
jgi:hypothetical protein